MRTALFVAQHRSLRQAAEALNLRQSTLSRRLRDLEHRLGAVLFERTNGGTRPTIAGREFFEIVQHIIDDTDTALQSLRSRSRGEGGRLILGVYASMATGNMQATVAEYHRRFPQVDVHVLDGSHSRLTCALERNAIDIAVMTNYSGGWDHRTLSLWSERVIVALPERHPLAGNGAVRWRDLAGEPLILPSQGPGAELESLLGAKLQGNKPDRVLQHEAGLDRLLSLVSAGYGILLMLEGGAGLRHEGVVYREVQDNAKPTRLSFRAYWRKLNENPTVGHFLEMLRERYPDFSGEPAT